MGAGGMAIGGANMWALLIDKDPGHSAAAGDLAVDVVDRRLKKAASVAVKVGEAPPADNVAKPAKRVNKAKLNTKSAVGCSKQAPAAVAAIVDDKIQTQMNGDGDRQVEAVTATVPYVVVQDVSKVEEEEQDFMVATRRTVRKATAAGSSTVVTGANMWALLSDEDPGHGTTTVVDVIDRKLKKAVVVEVAEPVKRDQSKMVNKEKKGAAGAGNSKQAAALAATVDSSGKVLINGAVDSKQTAAPAAVLDGDELTSNGRDEIEVSLAALPSKEVTEEEEAKEKVFNVVAARGGRRRTVAARTSKVAVVAEGVTAVTGTNMWALLSDDDPGHGGGKLATKGKKTKTKKKKKDAAGASKQTDSVDDDKEKETPAAAELEVAMSEDEEEMTSEPATGGSRCRTVASLLCKATVAVAMLALYFQLASTPPSHA